MTREELLQHVVAGTQDFRSADLTRSDLTGASPTRVDPTRVDPTGANLAGANLSGANLTRVNLTRVNLRGANLSKAALKDADLTGAKLDGTDLGGASLNEARGFRFPTTQGPRDFRDRLAAWLEANPALYNPNQIGSANPDEPRDVAGWASWFVAADLPINLPATAIGLREIAIRSLWLDGSPMPSFACNVPLAQVLVNLRS